MLVLPVVIGLIAPVASWGVSPDDPSEVPPNERLAVPDVPAPLAAVAPVPRLRRRPRHRRPRPPAGSHCV